MLIMFCEVMVNFDPKIATSLSTDECYATFEVTVASPDTSQSREQDGEPEHVSAGHGCNWQADRNEQKGSCQKYKDLFRRKEKQLQITLFSPYI